MLIPRRVKSSFLILFALSLLMPVSSTAQTSEQGHHFTTRLSDVASLQFYLRWTEYRPPLISAHRGGPEAGFPENCIETFENALTYSPCLIELDVAKTLDSVLVLMHDDTLGRTCTGSGPITAIDFDELRNQYLIAPNGDTTEFHSPTFGEVLDWARDRAILTVDVKHSVRPDEIVAQIANHDAAAYALVITYNANQAIAYHKLDPNLMLSVNIRNRDDYNRLADAGIPPKNMIAFVGVSEPDQELYLFLHSKGIRCILGTMGNLDRRALKKGVSVYEKLYRNGADVLSTDDVPLVARAIDALKYPQRQKTKSSGKSSRKR